MATGSDLVSLARQRIGQPYVLGTLVPKDNANWMQPWDCAEFTSWLVFQISGRLYGCNRNHGDPSTADAWTGYWDRDAHQLGTIVPVDGAVATAGAMLLRAPPAEGVPGHIVVSDGLGGTIEAKGSQFGVVSDTTANRRWDFGVLVPWVTYTAGASVPLGKAPKVLRLGDAGAQVRGLQKALAARGFDPGIIDGAFGSHTLAAVLAVQRANGLVVDGEVGPATRAAIGGT